MKVDGLGNGTRAAIRPIMVSQSSESDSSGSTSTTDLIADFRIMPEWVQKKLKGVSTCLNTGKVTLSKLSRAFSITVPAGSCCITGKELAPFPTCSITGRQILFINAIPPIGRNATLIRLPSMTPSIPADADETASTSTSWTVQSRVLTPQLSIMSPYLQIYAKRRKS